MTSPVRDQAMSSRLRPMPFLAIGVAVLVAACGSGPGVSVAPSVGSSVGSAAATPAAGSPSLTPATTSGDIHLIKHVIVVMQENRSFDTYFGTYPGVDGIPMTNGVQTVCIPDPARGVCDAPYHTTADKELGGPHGAANATADIGAGAMNGFVGQEEHAVAGCAKTISSACGGSGTPDVLAYMDQREIPNYWTLAGDFVLQDHMFEPDSSWSLPAHLFMVSGWSALCSKPSDPMSCQSNIKQPGLPTATNPQPYAWTDLTYLLYKNNVSWAY